MGLFDNARDSLKKYSGLVIDKTETLAKQAKISLEINNLNEKIRDKRAELGDYVLKKKGSGRKNISLDDDYIKQIDDTLKEIEKEIKLKKEIIRSLQKKENDSSSQDK